MRSLLFLLFSILFASVVGVLVGRFSSPPALSTFAVAETIPAIPEPVAHAALPFPEIEARSAAVVDGETGVLLGEKEKDLVLPIASVTKLMTALVFLDTQPTWEKTMVMERRDDRPGGALFVRPGERLTYRDLFMTALVGSANNAAIALTRAAGLSIDDFVDRMNQRAELLQLSETSFVEPTGLSAENRSTALDLVRLGWQAFRTPMIREALTAEEYVFRTVNTKLRHRIRTTNDLLERQADGYTIVGAKTGYTEEAGFTFLIEAEQRQGGKRVIVAVLGAPTEEVRFADAEKLIQWAFTAPALKIDF